MNRAFLKRVSAAADKLRAAELDGGGDKHLARVDVGLNGEVLAVEEIRRAICSGATLRELGRSRRVCKDWNRWNGEALLEPHRVREITVAADPPHWMGRPDDGEAKRKYLLDCHARGDIGEESGYGRGRLITASIIRGKDTVVGKIQANLVDRDSGEDFHEACDAHSQEMQEVSCTLFRASGQPRYGPLKRQAGVQTVQPWHPLGGFLYIEAFQLRRDAQPLPALGRSEEEEELATHAILKFLALPGLSAKWTVAMYFAEGGVLVEQFEAAADKDAQPFFRAGFSQVMQAHLPGYGWLYLTPDRVRLWAGHMYIQSRLCGVCSRVPTREILRR
jgi:hypothetical protein